MQTDTLACLGSRDGVRFDYRAPQIVTDAGRSLSKRPKSHNDCTVMALANATGLPYDEAYDILAKAGRKPHKGFHMVDWAKSATLPDGRTFRWKPLPAVKGQWRANPVSFAIWHPRGSYILRVSKHVMACVDGTIMDAWMGEPWRCVYGALEVVQ